MKTLMDLLYRWIVIVAMLAGATAAFAQESPSEVQAPFGLEWGASLSDFPGLTNCQTNQAVTYCTTISVPKTLSDAENHELFFDDKEGLVKVRYISKDITDDLFGDKGKARFNELKSALSSKYPKAEKKDLIGMHLTLYKDPDEFYECLRYHGCGVYVWSLKPGKGTITLVMEGLSRGKGYLYLSYESPKWRDVVNRVKSSEKADDKDAL